MSLLAALAAAGAVASSGAADAPYPGDTTPAINACFAAQLTSAETELNRYLAAARTRLRTEGAQASRGDTSAQDALAGLDKAEAAWAAYRDAACDAVYAYWQTGTIRTVQALSCEIELTQRHTHDIWSQWLTYMDSTPSILPEPKTPPA